MEKDQIEVRAGIGIVELNGQNVLILNIELAKVFDGIRHPAFVIDDDRTRLCCRDETRAGYRYAAQCRREALVGL